MPQQPLVMEIETLWPVNSFSSHGIVWYVAWIFAHLPDKVFLDFMDLVIKYGIRVRRKD